MKKVSVLVPVYNVEEHISDCLDSLVRQTHHNIELLCVDDCSTDNSYMVIESHASDDHRIKAIKHKENRGRGGARNTGIKYASGDYICFVDSDDYVSDRFVELLYRAVSKDESDVAVCSYMSDIDGVISKYETNFINSKNEINDNKENVLEVAMKFNPSCTNKIYKRDLLVGNNLLQPEGCYYEDVIFWLNVVYCSKSIISIPDRLYYYRQRSGSVMRSLTYKHIDDRFEFIRQIDAFVKNKILPIQDNDTHKIMDDLLVYLIRHIRYGVRLIDEAQLDNKEAINHYYDSKIRQFAIESNWPALSVSCK